jgi:hypothetical protein
MTGITSVSTLARIEAAMALPSRDDTIHDVKQAVIDEFERVDSKVEIHATQYFRHSFAPDLVLSWRDDVDRSERWVFLRSRVEPAYLLEDVATVARDQPIIFGLGITGTADQVSELQPPEVSNEPENHIEATLGHDDSVVAQLKERSTASGTLITDPAGIDALVIPDDATSSISLLVARQILRGGRGMFDEESSMETFSTINSGFIAAFDTGADATFKAAVSIRSHLGNESGERLLRLLHAVWIGSGGRSDLFPDAPAAEGALSDDALELLITGFDIDDAAFWARLGSVTLPQLGRLNVGDRPRNLSRLVAVNADKIEGRWCRVVPDEPRIAHDEANLLQWDIEKGALALHGQHFTAYLANEKKELDGIQSNEQSGIAVADLSARCAFSEASVSDMTASGGGLIIEVASDSADSVLDNPYTEASVGAAAENLTNATASLRNGHVVVCDFRHSTASSRTRGTLTLRELVRHGLPIVWPLAPDESEALAAMLSPVANLGNGDADARSSLFDIIDSADTSSDPSEDSTE